MIQKKPIAVLQNKKKKFYISTKGDLIDFQYIERYMDLPTVFGNGKFFYTLYQDLQNIQFPLKSIKSFYFFESGRWDLVMYDDKIIKLPIKDYLVSLKNYMESKNNSNFDSYKIFDYRIKDQLILNQHMEIDHPTLYVEINDTNYIFVANIYDEKKLFFGKKISDL